MRRHPALYLGVIILIALACGVFVYPRGFGATYRPWRLGLDLVGGSHLIYAVDTSGVPGGDEQSVLNGLRDVIERRVNLFGVSEPQVFIARTGSTPTLVVELAGVKDVNQAIGEIGETPFLDFREVVGESTATSTEATSSARFVLTELSGRYVTGAQVIFNPTTGAPEVAITFNSEGATLFEELTGRNVGKPLGIFLDGELIEAPIVQAKIPGGNAQITGRYTLQQAKQLVERFNAGALPAPITLINQQTVSPTLGTDSLRKGILAGAVGTALVVLFMLLYYRLYGLFASGALVIYVAVTLALFKLIPITLTLAGLAGFILTIGMAVDANILIFERVKEELRRGLSRAAAIEEGFRRAWPSIRDSNMSTMITAVILYFATSSFVRGFALTLLLGVLVSMFSAITTTRLLMRTFLGSKGKPTA